MLADETALPPRSTALLLALTASLLVFRLGAVPLLGPDEPRYARVAVEMGRSGDWVTPTLQGQPWLEKPALYYWLAAAAFKAFGETEVAARLPSVLACVFLVGVTALVGARLYGRSAGLHAGFILGTAVLPFAYGRAASMDMLLAATTTASIGLLALAFLGVAGRAAVPVAAAFAGLATLAKGPLGLLLPALVAAGFVAWTRDFSLVRKALSGTGLILFVLVAAPWYTLISLAQGRAFLDVFILNHNLQRFTSTIHHHPGPFYFYVPLVVGGFFCWSGLLLPGLAGLRPRTSRRDGFVLLWFLLPFLLFSAAASKLPGYILPCLPPLALLMGRAADRLVRGETSWPPGTGPRAVALLTLILASLVPVLPANLLKRGDPGWLLTLPLAVWAVMLALSVSRRLAPDPAGALRLLRVGAAGFLLLLAAAAPPILARQESGRVFFTATWGREVLVWGAWRTSWMAGYFYNDARVRQVAGYPEILASLDGGPVLVLCGPGERRQLEANAVLATIRLIEGPRGNVLLRVERRGT
jgi:4-amino-4-deoxy-L-arabinose transferase-like glycosyltransferase